MVIYCKIIKRKLTITVKEKRKMFGIIKKLK